MVGKCCATELWSFPYGLVCSPAALILSPGEARPMLWPKGMTELSRCGDRCGPWSVDGGGASGTDGYTGGVTV